MLSKRLPTAKYPKHWRHPMTSPYFRGRTDSQRIAEIDSKCSCSSPGFQSEPKEETCYCRPAIVMEAKG